MEYVLGFMIFSAIVSVIALWVFPHTVTWQEVLIGVCIQTAIIAVIFYGSIYAKGHDIQILNGYVTEKVKDRVSCEHSYSCNCRQSCSGSGKSRSCSTTCQTCYDHPFDYDWLVRSTVGTLDIDRVDRQGLVEPPRWTEVKIGEFFAKEGSYFNYIKASPLTIFDKNLINNTTAVPSYIGVHDYYRLNRVVNYQSQYVGDFALLNTSLNESLKTLGGKKKVNVMVVFHKFGPDFVDTVKAKLYGGKINDVVVMINASSDGYINAVNVFSWSKDDIVNIKIRDSVLDIGTLGDMEVLSKAITTGIEKNYVARSIEEFKYLNSNIDVSSGVAWAIWIIGLVFPFIWSYIAHAHLWNPSYGGGNSRRSWSSTNSKKKFF